MKYKTKAIPTILLFGILAIFSSCKGQKPSESKDVLDSQNKAVAIGEIVSEIVDEGITVIFQDKNENYWFAGGDEGAYKYDGKNLVFFTLKDGLCNKTITRIQEDKHGNIYFDTPECISKFDGQKFTTLTVIDSSITKNEWKLEPDDLWFGMGWDKNGPFRYDGESLHYLEFPKTELADEFYAKYPNVSYSPYGIYTMYNDKEGSVWFGTASLGVCRYDGQSLSWLYEEQLSKTPSGGDFGFRSIIEDKDGYFWFCNTRHRYEILPNSTEKNGTSYLNYKRENGIGKLGGNNESDFPYFLSIAKDNNGDLWMATYDEGVWRNNGKELIHYPIKDGFKNVLLFSIYKDKEGTLWLGTHNAGVYKFNGYDFERFKA